MSTQRKPETSNPAPRGRPRDPARRERILAAAQQLFGESGLDGTSLDRIAQAAEVSKVTLYSYFDSKEALFNATITEPFNRMATLALPTLDAQDPRSALAHLATNYARQLLDPQVVAHMRMLVAGSTRNAALAQAFFETGPAQLSAALVAYLKRAHAARTLRIADAAIAAEQFISMVRGQEHLRALMGLPPARGPRSRAKYIEGCVDAFLAAHSA